MELYNPESSVPFNPWKAIASVDTGTSRLVYMQEPAFSGETAREDGAGIMCEPSFS